MKLDVFVRNLDTLSNLSRLESLVILGAWVLPT